MREKLDELYKLMQINRKISPWVKQLSIKEATKELHGEVIEVLEALEKKDDENLKEEIGDVLSDTFLLMVVAQEQKEIEPKEIVNGVVNKLKTRKPFLVEEREVTSEEEHQLWHTAKNKEIEEKNERNRN